MFRFRSRTRLAVRRSCCVVGALSLAACGGGDDDDSEAEGDEEAATTSTTEEPTTTTTLPPVIAPLTGLPDATGTSPTRAAVTVKVDNVPERRPQPQAGIEVADVVYEEPVEGTTRASPRSSTRRSRRVSVRCARLASSTRESCGPSAACTCTRAAPPTRSRRSRRRRCRPSTRTGCSRRGARQRDSQCRAPHNLFALTRAAARVGPGAEPHPAARAVHVPRRGPAVQRDAGEQDRDQQPTPTPSTRGTRPAGAGSGRRSIDASDQVEAAPRGIGYADRAGERDRAAASAAWTTRRELVGDGQAWVCTAGQVHRGDVAAVRPRRRDASSSTQTASVLALTPGSTWVHLVIGDDPTITP